MQRKPVNKFKAAKKFNKNVSRTKRINTAPAPARGGYRL